MGGTTAALDDEEIALFKELAGDTAYGLQALRAHAQRDEARQTLLRLECVDDKTAKPCQDLLENCMQITRSLTAELCPPVPFIRYHHPTFH